MSETWRLPLEPSKHVVPSEKQYSEESWLMGTRAKSCRTRVFQKWFLQMMISSVLIKGT